MVVKFPVQVFYSTKVKVILDFELYLDFQMFLCSVQHSFFRCKHGMRRLVDTGS